MMSCIWSLYIALLALPVPQAAPPPAAPSSADALYARRDDPSSAVAAEKAWSDQLRSDPKNFDVAWKLARARYWLGGHPPPGGSGRDYFEGGIAAGRAAVALQPNRPEGHFWIAANMGGLAEGYGLRQGLKYRGDIKDELMTVLKLDPAYLQGSADRALGRWYFKVPGLFGGSKQKSEEHLRRSLTYAPNSTASHYFLAETLLDMGRKADATKELQRVIDGPIDPDWEPEDREFKEKAKGLLGEMK